LIERLTFFIPKRLFFTQKLIFSFPDHTFPTQKLIFPLPTPVILAGRDLFLSPKHRFPTQKLIFFSPNTIFFTDIRAVSLDFSTTKSKIRAVEGRIGSFAGNFCSSRVESCSFQTNFSFSIINLQYQIGNFRSSRRQNRPIMIHCHKTTYQ
jgi:hypothetical protein